MKRIKSGIIAAAVLIGTSLSVQADIPYDVEYDWLNSSLTLSGDKCTDGDFITVQILKKDKTFDNFDYSELLYGNQATVNNGKYSFDVGYNAESGVYNARIASAVDRETADFKVVISTRADMEAIYAALNSAVEANDSAAFNAEINENLVFLAANSEQNVGIKGDDYFKYVKSNRLIVDNISDNTKVFNTFLLMESLNGGSTENINSKVNKVSINSEDLKKDYKRIAEDLSVQKYFTKKMSKRQLSTVEDFNNCFREALVLAAARYGSGYGELQAIVAGYGKAVGITDASSSASVYKQLIGKDYEDGTAFEKAYRAAVKSNTGSGTTGGSSSGGSSGSSKGSAITAPGMTNNSSTSIKVRFDDIEGVDWANEAIIALADKKIIAGKEEGKFKPNDNITREEFAKILVGAMGYSERECNTNVFADVSESDWFCGWVNTAYEKGILNGTGEGCFGVGENISRQDMCVMLVNAMRIKGVQMNAADISFADSGDIADYAVDAVRTLFGMNVVNGVDGNNFEPRGNATRAQAAKVVYAVLEKLQ